MTEARPAWMALSAIVTALLVLIGGPAVANDVTAWQMDLVTPASPVMEEIKGLYDYLTWIAIAIVLFVLALLAYVCIRFSATRNPEPSKTSHNTLLEVVWTAIPVVILATIAVPSLKLLYFMDKTHEADMTLKVIGHQWYWSYEYPDHGDFVFDAFMLYKEDLEENQPRLLTTDNAVVLPVDTNIRVLTTSTDVIHSWALPSMGVKTDSIPGRTNETWLRITKPGVYYGQCSELCGINHGFMPITVKAVPKEEFTAWVEEAKEQFARVDDTDDGSQEENQKLAFSLDEKGTEE